MPLADLVLVMSVNPGLSGQTFMPEMIGKVEELRNKLNALCSPAYLEVDGGISVDTLPLMRKAGADAFVAGIAVFKHPKGAGEGIKVLRNVVARRHPSTGSGQFALAMTDKLKQKPRRKARRDL